MNLSKKYKDRISNSIDNWDPKEGKDALRDKIKRHLDDSEKR